MRRASWPFVVLLVSCHLGSSTPQAPVLVEKEPRHQVKFENAYVRVIDARVPVGDQTLFHTHERDNVPVAITGGKVKVELLGKEGTISTVGTGSVSFAKGGYTHRVTNAGDTPLRFIDAEILSSPGMEAGIPPLQPEPVPLREVAGFSVAFENDRVTVYRLVLEPGASTGPHTHGQPGLSVAIVDGCLAVKEAGSAPGTKNLTAGEFWWRDGMLTHTVENAGKAAFELVDIEWK
ncbi:MAG: hypothetical protein HY650_09700 [Acidobacteria bacterium]|nr:hypothetical protein [Acidobacteriota bacterium]